MSSKINAKIVAFSCNKQGDKIYTYELLFPRIILSEVNTHREASKNTSSSRAIPFKKIVETVKNDPFIPIAWQKHHKGMQGSEYFQEGEYEAKKIAWLRARDKAVEEAKQLYSMDVTKQLCNRLLEPFMWVRMIFTISEKGLINFFELRCPKYTVKDENGEELEFKTKEEVLTYFDSDFKVDVCGEKLKLSDLTELQWYFLNRGQAEIHFMELAEQMYSEYFKYTFTGIEVLHIKNEGDWHIPYIRKIEKLYPNSSIEEKVKISIVMCARTSYTLIEDSKSMTKERCLELYEELVNADPIHGSPMQHCLRAMTYREYNSFARGIVLKNMSSTNYIIPRESLGWCYNNKGFIQARYLIERGLTL